MKNIEDRKAYRKCIQVVLLSVFKDKKMRRTFFWVLISLVLGACANLLTPLLLKEVVESFSSKPALVVSLILVSYGLIWIVNQASVYFRGFLSYRIEQRIAFVLGLKVLSHLYNLSSSFFLDQKPGALTNMLRKAQYSVPSIVLALFFYLLPTLLEFLFVVTLIAVSYPPFYTFLMGSTLGAFVLFTSITAKNLLKSREDANEVDREVDGLLADWLSNYEAVKVFGRQKLVTQFLAKELKEKELAETNFMKKYTHSQLGRSLVLGLGLSVLTYFVGQGVLEKTLSIGDFILFNGYILQFITPVGILGQVFQDLKNALIDMKGVMDILLTQSEVTESPNPLVLSKESFSIRFEDVSFKYEDRIVLDRVSFNIEPGETALIFGPTGSGKSTIAKLLLRLYDPTYGNIFFDGEDLRNYSLSSLSEKIGWVPQEGYLLNDTIENNLRFVSPEATDLEVELALERAQLLHFVEKLPKGLDTVVGNRGLKLSGGEKQRLSLARLFLKKPRVCIFDECTSSLDKKTDLIVQNNIKEFLPGSVKIIITHRPFIAYHADKVINLEKPHVLGKIKESLVAFSV